MNILNAPLGEKTPVSLSDTFPLGDDYYAKLLAVYIAFANRDKYIISPSVASNNLTITILGIDGNAPSATNPVPFRVGNSAYTLTATTSFTKNAATNWCNAGSAELAAKDIDFFMYAIGETGVSAGLKFGFSRIPYAQTMTDFVNTSTSEKYIAGNWTNFNATDPVTVIGRFRAQLSATAAFNWSIPTAKVINRPIYNTDRLNWTPTITGYSANPASGIYEYVVNNNFVTAFFSEPSNGTSNATSLTETVPFTAASLASMVWDSIGNGLDNSAALATPVRSELAQASNVVNFYPNMSATSTWTASGGKRVKYTILIYPVG